MYLLKRKEIVMIVKYPRDCEIWEDTDSGTTFLVPSDVKSHVMKAKVNRNVQCQAEFIAKDRIHMMKTFYLLTGRGVYSPPEKNRTIKNIPVTNNKTPKEPVAKKPSVVETIKVTLERFGRDNFRRARRAVSFSNEM
jgi:hypothetical protein